MTDSELKPKDYKEIRKLAFQFCFQEDCHQIVSFDRDHFLLFCQQNNVVPQHRQFFQGLVEKAFENLHQINEIITQHSKNWVISRMNRVDLAVLRIGVVELMIRLDTDHRIIVSESTEIAKNFGSSSSSSFVNGILDAVAKKLRSLPS